MIQDLPRFELNPATMITPQPWFDLPDFEDNLLRLNLSVRQQKWVRQLREDGFFVIDEPVVDEDTLDETIRGLSGKYVRIQTEHGVLSRIQDAWQHAPSVKRIALSSSVINTLSAIYQRTPIPFQTLNFELSTQQRVHSDTIHFNSLPHGFMCGVWLALEDTDLDNGPLCYYRGSHKLPVYHMQDFGLCSTADDYRKYEDIVEEILKKGGFPWEQGTIKKGQAIVWAANLFHGGSRVLDPTRTRHSQVTHYYFDGALYYTPIFSNPLKGQFFMRQLRDIGTRELRPQLMLPQTPELAKSFLGGLLKTHMLGRIRRTLESISKA